MSINKTSYLVWAGLAFGATLPAYAVALISPTDPVFGISINQNITAPPAGQAAPQAVDNNPATKYLNFSKFNTGIIYTGSSPFTVQSLGLTTGGDAPERDPTSYILLGSNDASINTSTPTSVSNGWTYISSGSLSLSGTRGSVSSLNVTNSSSYSSYWLVFPTVKDSPSTANSMQIAEADLYSGASATGTEFTATTVAGTAWSGSFPNNSANAEQPNKVIDGDPATKYLNFGKEGTGFEVIPSVGNTVPTGFVLTSANDTPGRDPVGYTIYGQSITGVWSTIIAGTLTADQLPAARSTAGTEIPYTTNGTIFQAYAFIANTLASSGTVNSFQLGDFQVNGYAIPETSSALLGMLGVFGLAGLRRRK